MNKERRKAIYSIIEHLNELNQKMMALSQDLEDTKDTIDDILDEEEEYRDNMPENLQGGERYDKADQACDHLSSAVDHIDNIISAMDKEYEDVLCYLESAII